MRARFADLSRKQVCLFKLARHFESLPYFSEEICHLKRKKERKKERNKKSRKNKISRETTIVIYERDTEKRCQHLIKCQIFSEFNQNRGYQIQIKCSTH